MTITNDANDAHVLDINLFYKLERNRKHESCFPSHAPTTSGLTIDMIKTLETNIVRNILLLVNLYRSTRTNKYAGMQMFLTTNLKRDWSAYLNTDLLSKTKTRANRKLICIIVCTRYITHDS